MEHPVTEEVTGLDIVELQLRVAAGEPIELADAARGHAIEARLYAEDPQSFLPQAGAIRRLVLPAAIRVDAGVEEGDEIGLSYDPLIAKLIALGADRDDAIARLEHALDADGCRWRHDEPPVPALARAPPGVPLGLDLDRLPSRARTALGGATPSATERVRTRVAFERPCASAPPAPEVAATLPASASLGRATITAPMPGTVLASRWRRATTSRPTTRSSSSRQ